MAKNDAASKAGKRRDFRAGDQSTSGGASDTLAKLLAVMPSGPRGVMVVTTVTPVAKRPSASRSSLSLKSGKRSPGFRAAHRLDRAAPPVDARLARANPGERPAMTDRDARLTELEIALAHQERLGEDLSEMVRDQADRLDRARAAGRGARSTASRRWKPAAPPRRRPTPGRRTGDGGRAARFSACP